MYEAAGLGRGDIVRKVRETVERLPARQRRARPGLQAVNGGRQKRRAI